MTITNYEIYQQIVEQMQLLNNITEKLENNVPVSKSTLLSELKQVAQKIVELKSVQDAAGLSCTYAE